VIWKQNNTTRK